MSIALRWQDTEEEMETVYNTYTKHFRSKNILRWQDTEEEMETVYNTYTKHFRYYKKYFKGVHVYCLTGAGTTRKRRWKKIFEGLPCLKIF